MSTQAGTAVVERFTSPCPELMPQLFMLQAASDTELQLSQPKNLSGNNMSWRWPHTERVCVDGLKSPVLITVFPLSCTFASRPT